MTCKASRLKALSTAEGLKGWYTPNLEGQLAEGKEAVFRFTDEPSFRWRFAKISPDLVRWECVEGPGAARGTSVTFRPTDVLEGTVVDVDHENWPEAHDKLKTCNTLWGILMGHLRAYVESGKPGPAFR